jgi:predicted outer membrane repeat protein
VICGRRARYRINKAISTFMKTASRLLHCFLSATLLLLVLAASIQAANQTVSNLGDTGLASQLRQKIVACQSGTSPGGTITFSVAGTIMLDPVKGPLPLITTNVTINGGSTVEISGGNTGTNGTRIFNVNAGATLTLKNITLSHAYSASGDGGAVASTGTLNANNAKFLSNATSASWSGSAILCWGPLTITGCEFGFNSGGGGAVKPRSSGAITTITGTNFHDNQSNGTAGGGYGGAMQVFDGPSVTISNSTFNKNSAVHGGAVYVSTNATLNVNDSTFSGNSGAHTGGAIDNAGTTTLRRVTLDHNSTDPEAGGEGGGLYNSATATLENVTLSGNSSTTGGGINTAWGSGPITLTNVTLSGNSAPTGGGIYNGGAFVNGSVALSLKNTLLQKGSSGTNCYSFGGVGGEHSLSDDGSCGFSAGDNITDLFLGPLANNGGPTLTYLPQPGSRAIDNGTGIGAPATDQRGIKRPQLAGVDIGAVEVVPQTFQDTDPSILYDNWFDFGSPNASGGFFRSSNHTSDTVTYKFNATSIKWITRKGPEMGKALVTIDGVNKGTFDLYKSSALWNQQFLFSGLASATHNIVIKVIGTKNASSSDFLVALDGFQVGSSTNAVQESALGVQYNKWIGKTQATASGGSYRVNGSLGADLKFQFSGTSILFVTARGPSYGKVNLYIDGMLVSSNLDLYAPTQQWQYKIGYSGLANGFHVIDVLPAHTKNASSSGYGVVVDAFQAFPNQME